MRRNRVIITLCVVAVCMLVYAATKREYKKEEIASDTQYAIEESNVLVSDYEEDIFEEYNSSGEVFEERSFVESDKTLEPEECGYWIIEMPYYLPEDDYSFNCVQVDGMEDDELQDKVNDSLKKYLYLLDSNIAVQESTQCEIYVYLQSAKYLSIRYFFDYAPDGKSATQTNLCITVDMHNGAVVFLDDLIDINENFALLIKTGGILKREAIPNFITAKENTRIVNANYNRTSMDAILRIFNEFTKEKYYEFIDLEDMYYNLRRYFYLEEGAICFTYHEGEINKILLDDIEEFLKVPKW